MQQNNSLLKPDTHLMASAEGENAMISIASVHVYLSGIYYEIVKKKHVKKSEHLAIPIADIYRIGMIKFYSRKKFSVMLGFIGANVFLKRIPNFAVEIPIIKGIYSFNHTFWELPYNEFLGNASMIGFAISAIFYLLSYGNYIEVNSRYGRYLLSPKGMNHTDILAVIQQSHR